MCLINCSLVQSLGLQLKLLAISFCMLRDAKDCHSLFNSAFARTLERGKDRNLNLKMNAGFSSV